MEEDGQTAIEYLLLLGGVILIAAIVVLVVRSQIISPFQLQVDNNATSIREIIKKVS